MSVKEVMEKVGSNERGLNQKDVSNRLNVYGRNQLKKTRHFDAIKVFLEQFKSFLIIILIFAAVLAFFMESKVDAVVIVAIIILNSFLGFFQEYKASKAIDDLNKMMVTKVRVLRNKRIMEVNSETIVPGDIIVLSEGDKIMADARIMISNGMRVNEASLTGESVADEKINKVLESKVVLADRKNMIYQGTEVMGGNGRAVVVNTGIKTELGQISELVQEIHPEKNPFKEKLDIFAKKIGIFILFLCLIIVVILSFSGVEILQSLLVAVSLAVSVIPEGLPAVISLGLAMATRRMIKKNVLIRKLPASETLGRATVICVDKTGTLTEGEMKVVEIYTNGKINPAREKETLFKIGVLCNSSVFEKDEKGEYFLGDSTEVALIKVAKDNFVDKNNLEKEEIKIKEFPFSSERKMMAIIRERRGKIISYVKGAPEKIIERCNYEMINGRKIKIDEKDRQRLISVYEKMAERGLRILGFAYKDLPMSFNFKEDLINDKMAENGLIFVGFQGMIDPPRAEIKNAIKVCNDAGIKVIMMTGDSELTAKAVAKEIGLMGESINAVELEKISDKELFKKIKSVSVFARISPQDKLRIINILKQKNEIVAMTGDGVNDALALKRADIGIAMGIRGTDVARDSSDIVLVDDNFASIVEGVREGRTVYDNIKKFVKFLLSANFSEVILIFLVMLVWRNPELLPLLPLQILWINLVTDGFPALALSAESMERDVMKRKPSRQNILKGIKGFILISGVVAFLIEFLFFYLYMNNIDLARTMIVTSSVTFQMFLVFSCKSKSSVFKSPFNKYLFYAVGFSMGLQLLVLYSPLNSLFYFVPLSVMDWLWIFGFSVVGWGMVEGWKLWERKNPKSF